MRSLILQDANVVASQARVWLVDTADAGALGESYWSVREGCMHDRHGQRLDAGQSRKRGASKLLALRSHNKRPRTTRRPSSILVLAS